MRRGLYRIRGVGGLPDGVRAEDDGIEVPMEESLYRARGHLPRLDDLPWQEDLLSKQQSTDREESAEKAAREQAKQDFLSRFRKP